MNRCLWASVFCVFFLIPLESTLEKAMAPHPSTLAWKIPWMEEPGRLQSMDRWGSDTTEQLPFHFSLSCIGEGNGKPLQCSCLENTRDGEAWWAAIYGVAQSRTQLEQLRSSSSSNRVNMLLVSLWPLWHYHCLFPLLYWPLFPVSICIFSSFYRFSSRHTELFIIP